MSSALGMNLMPPTSAFQHGMPSASSESDQDQKPTSKPSDADVLDQEDHQKSNQDNKNNASSSAGDPYDMDSDSERTGGVMSDHNNSVSRRLSQEEDERSLVGEEESEDHDEPMNTAEDSECTYGSPGLRTAFNNSNNVIDEDDDTKEESSMALINSPSRSRNKRKNFKPRNIVNSEVQQPKLLMKNADNGPMDLSLQGSANGAAEDTDDDEDEASSEPMSETTGNAASAGLSVVRPEVLFGANKDVNMLNNMPPFLAPFLAASQASTPGGPSMKDAFQEVLKLFGFPPELAEVFAKNAQAVQQMQNQGKAEASSSSALLSGLGQDQDARSEDSQQSSQQPSSQRSAGSPPPGLPASNMLSAALLGSTTPNSNNSHPPTPPRTPKMTAAALAAAAASGVDIKPPPLAHSQAGPNGPPAMPPLLSLAAIQEQVNKGPNILAAQLSKPMMIPGLPGSPPWPLPGSAGGPPGGGPANAPGGGLHSQIPPHILAAQRAGVLPGSTKSPTDYTRYFRRFSSSLECGSYYCKDMNYREHFHCTVPMCKSKVFAKKEEMIRHSKWHQKMDEAYKYGFRRVTPTDDCSDQFPGCQHNKKQTHYHCIQSGHCDKVYISTSDVQMHFNYHRKDNAIQREGFLRFRGCEDCATHYCPFRGQKTTHFHCNRSGCQFTFKNKADMEKHKNFHMKDEQLNKDGFKKFMKQDPCGYDNCRFSKTVNHIHCIRANCDYVLHSSGQLFAHKRKHDRKDNELAYRKYKLTQSMLASLGPNPTEEQKAQVEKIAEAAAATMNGSDMERPASNGSMHSESSTTPPLQLPPSMQPQPHFQPPPPPPQAALSMLPQLRPHLPGFGFQPPHQPLPASGIFGGMPPMTSTSVSGQPMLLSEIVRERVPDDAWQNYILHFDSGEGCGFQGCEVEDLSHYHCKDDGCEMVFRHEDGVRDHGRNHFIQDQISELFFVRGDPEDEPEAPECSETCPHRKVGLHYHCKWENCSEVIFNSDPPFKRLDHYKLHEYTRKWNFSSANKEPVTMTLTTSIDAMFKRKRGRPPKNRVIEVWNDNFGPMSGMPAGELHGSPQAVFTSFKLPKPGGGEATQQQVPSGPGSPVTSQSLAAAAAAGFGSRLFPIGLGNPPIPNAPTITPPKVSAPLGGLPALADQILMQSQNREKKAEELEESNNNTSSKEASRSPPGTPPPTKKRADGDTSGSEGTPPKHQGMIKAKGTYYPLTAFPTHMPQGPVMRRDGSSPPRPAEQTSSGDEVSPTISLKSKLGVNFMVSFSRADESENPLAKLLQASQDMVSGQTSTTASNAANIAGPSNELPAILSVAAHPQFGPEPEEESCGRPFCKLKRRPHFHCNICNQGFTEKDKLEPHLKRHASPQELSNSLAAMLKEPVPKDEIPPAGSPPLSLVVSTAITTTATTSMVTATSNSSGSPTSSPKSSPPPPPSSSTPNLLSNAMQALPPGFPPPPFGLLRHPLTSSAAASSPSAMLLSSNPFLPPGIMIPGMPHPFPRFPVPDGRLTPTSPSALQSLSRMPGDNKRSSPMSDILNDDSLNPEQKKMRLQSSMRMLKDEPVPDGYMRFRFNEDCGFSCCNYREHQTHFHCMRKDCNYRFCDKTRFVQHTARHERLDTLCGEEFEGFRGVPCGRPNCELNALHQRMPVAGDAQKSSSHFHCLKCEYYCTDTNKVVAHRRQHQKLDSIMAAGFEKYTPTQFCPISGCPHNGKQTHYHCSKCQYAVLGLSQMEGHKYRHMNE